MAGYIVGDCTWSWNKQKDGTLILPLWLSRGENAHLPACFACLSSQDQGKTWRCSSVVPAGNGVGDPTESSVAERSDGTLLATMRHEIPGVRRRAFVKAKRDRWGRYYTLGRTLVKSRTSGSNLWRRSFVTVRWEDGFC